MKNPKITLTKDGLKLIDAPEKSEFNYWKSGSWNEQLYNQALQEAINNGVFFKDNTNSILLYYIATKTDKMEYGKLYGIPEGCLVYVDDETLPPKAFLEPLTKQEPENDPIFELAMEAVEFGGKKSGDDNPVPEGQSNFVKQPTFPNPTGEADTPDPNRNYMEDLDNLTKEIKESTPVIEQKEVTQELLEYIDLNKHSFSNEFELTKMKIYVNSLKNSPAESKQLTPNDSLPMDFVLWYSGMSKQQVLNSYQRFISESLPKPPQDGQAY